MKVLELFLKKNLLEETEPLQFDAPPEEDTVITDLPGVSTPQKSTIDQYSNLSDSERRLRILYDIKTGKIDIEEFPSYLRKHIQNFANTIEPSTVDGKLVVAPGAEPSSLAGRLKPKVDRLIMTGRVGDLADAPNNPMWTQLADNVFRELEPLLHSDHPSRYFDRLDRTGKIDDMIKTQMRRKNFDLFAIPAWFKGALKAVSLERRKEASQEKLGNIK